MVPLVKETESFSTSLTSTELYYKMEDGKIQMVLIFLQWQVAWPKATFCFWLLGQK